MKGALTRYRCRSLTRTPTLKRSPRRSTIDTIAFGTHVRLFSRRLASTSVSVSIVVAVYNLERYVHDCLESVGNQDVDDLEIIIVDDASTDGSLAVIRRWVKSQDRSVTVIAHERNEGALRTFNDGLRACTREYVSILDGDDLLGSGVLRTHCALLDEAAPQVAVVFGDVQFISEDGSPLRERYFDGMTPYTGDILVPLIEHGSVLAVIGTVVRRSVVHAVGGFDESLAYLDWPLWIRIAHAHEFGFSGIVAGQYRQHAASMSRTRAADLRLARMTVLSRLLDQHQSPEVRAAARAHAVRVARSMWSAKDGADARRSCWELLKRTRDARLAAVLIATSLKVSERQVSRIGHRLGTAVRRIRPT